ncbi:hypothetical protein FGO68_gene12247 [Halteria grandinella]|uniref:Uncharacterized protein n=1 Tax=Halteria grandinella TaxID=5974 RepID=A0A8J8SYJ0_HALGN|nr:hypothetical protein FGO68_gene12247 [Halteria grandinella]
MEWKYQFLLHLYSYNLLHFIIIKYPYILNCTVYSTSYICIYNAFNSYPTPITLFQLLILLFENPKSLSLGELIYFEALHKILPYKCLLALILSKLSYSIIIPSLIIIAAFLEPPHKIASRVLLSSTKSKVSSQNFKFNASITQKFMFLFTLRSCIQFITIGDMSILTIFQQPLSQSYSLIMEFPHPKFRIFVSFFKYLDICNYRVEQSSNQSNVSPEEFLYLQFQQSTFPQLGIKYNNSFNNQYPKNVCKNNLAIFINIYKMISTAPIIFLPTQLRIIMNDIVFYGYRTNMYLFRSICLLFFFLYSLLSNLLHFCSINCSIL